MGCATHYIITDGKRYIGVDNDTKENIIVESYKKAVKLRFTQVNAIYNKLASNTKDVMGIISLISSTFRDLLTTSRLLKKGYSQNDIAKFYGISSGRAYYIVKDAKSFKLEDLEENVARLAELDFKIKSGQIDKNTGIELFLLRI